MSVWVAPADALDSARPVTSAKTHLIFEAHWTFDGAHLVYFQDEAGDENFHLYRVTVDTGEIVDLTPFDGAGVGGFELSPRKQARSMCRYSPRVPAVRFHTLVPQTFGLLLLGLLEQDIV